MNPNLMEQFLGPSTQFFRFNSNDIIVTPTDKKTCLLTKRNVIATTVPALHSSASSSSASNANKQNQAHLLNTSITSLSSSASSSSLSSSSSLISKTNGATNSTSNSHLNNQDNNKFKTSFNALKTKFAQNLNETTSDILIKNVNNNDSSENDLSEASENLHIDDVLNTSHNNSDINTSLNTISNSLRHSSEQQNFNEEDFLEKDTSSSSNCLNEDVKHICKFDFLFN